MSVEQAKRLTAFAEELGETQEAIILFTILGNRFAGVSNEPIARFCAGVAKQILADLES